jgi:hypothetical protein
MRHIAAKALVILWVVISISCAKTAVQTDRGTGLSTAASLRPLANIDLVDAGYILPDGRVQDRPRKEGRIVDELIAHGKEAIPFLIDNLEDERTIQDPNSIDYIDPITVGDVALLMLSDFSTDSNGKKTIPGSAWSDLFGRPPDPDVSVRSYLDQQVSLYGRSLARTKWLMIWENYKDRIVWDNKERCFKII